MKPLLFILLFFVASANAGSFFSGFKQTDKGAYLDFEDTIQRVEETDAAFMVGFYHHAAFYLFPKDARADQLRAFFNKCQKFETPVKIEFNPFSTQIYKISTK